MEGSPWAYLVIWAIGVGLALCLVGWQKMHRDQDR